MQLDEKDVYEPNSLRTEESNPFDEFLDRYTEDPVLFVREVLGLEPDHWQIEVLEAYANRDRRISIRSCHGPGKTAVASWCALHHFICRFPQKTVVTAPSSPQLFDAFFAELKHWMKKLPESLQVMMHPKSDRIEHAESPESSFISCRTSRADQPEALQGVHSAWVLLIGDEASGIPEPVYESAIGSMSGHNAMTILISNPTQLHGTFYDSQTRLKEQWTCFHVSHEDSDRVSDDFVQDVIDRYGEESNAYRVRVLGEFPHSDMDSLIPANIVEAAIHRVLDVNPADRNVWGVDVARFGSDRSALCKRSMRAVLEPVKVWKHLDTMQLVGRIKHEWDVCVPHERPVEILVDAIGIGAGVADRLAELKLPAIAINVSESPSLGEEYKDLRSELWDLGREWLAAKVCSLPDDAVLATELPLQTYQYMSSGKLMVHPKEVVKKKLGVSPDVADAFIMTFATDAITAIYGRPRSDWSEPLRRDIAIV